MNQYQSQLTLKISLFPTTREKGRSVGKYFFSSSKKVNEFQNMRKSRSMIKCNKMICALSEDSDQARHPPRLISLSCPDEETLGP